MATERFLIPGAQSPLAALFDTPDGRERTSSLLLAHGAGAGMTSAWLEALTAALLAHGYAVMRFEYPFMTRARTSGRRMPPDPAARLEEAHARALAHLAERRPRARLLSAGKSMGGRVASHIAARGTDAGRTAGLVLLGFPLHPAGKPAALRAEHFPALVEPALFLQGTRDRLCDLELLRRALERYAGRATLSVVPGADHDFARPQALTSGAPPIATELAARIAAWEESTFPPTTQS